MSKGRFERMKVMDEFNRVPLSRRPKNHHAFLAGLIGVIAGALFVWILMPTSHEEMTDKVLENKNTVLEEQVDINIHTDITDIVGEVADSVVGVTNLQTVRDVWSFSEEKQETGTGSGVIYKKSNGKAYIISNHHVVEDAEMLEITFDDGTKTDGKLVGSDMWTDLAVIEIDDSDVQAVATFGDSDLLKRGETVIAIGNPLGLGFSGSVTVGVVSGKDRSIPIDLNKDGHVDWHADVLQTDAAINPGNSGGALINLGGQLIGINSMKISQETVEGIGLAIPINLAAPIIEKLEKHGKVIRPTMGVTLIDLAIVPIEERHRFLQLNEEVKEGVVVNEVIPNSAAQTAGLEKYDVITEMDGEIIGDMVSLRKHLYNSKEVGDSMTIKVYRQGKQLEVKMVLEDGTSF